MAKTFLGARDRVETEIARAFEPTLGLLGDVYFVDYNNGVDANGYGKSIRKPFKTLDYAYGKTTSRNNDVIFLIGTATSAASTSCYVTAEITWSNHLTHLIGVGAAATFNSRARVAHVSTFTAAAGSLITVSAHGCLFKNVALYDGVTYANRYCLEVSGQRNMFERVSILGKGGALAAANAASASLYLNGGSENEFNNCWIGLDTVAVSAANSQIRMRSAATRNRFIDCDVVSYGSASAFMVDANASGALDRYTIFKNCHFTNAPTSLVGGAATMTTAFKVHASCGGYFDCPGLTTTGITDVDGDTTGRVFLHTGAPTAASSALGVAASAS